MDAEHVLLLDLYRQLSASLLSDGDVDAFATSFESLLEYAVEHFAHEEEVMRLCCYPDYAEHRKAHVKLLQTGTDLVQTIRVRFEEYDCYALLLFIRHWLTSHIRDHDDLLASFLLGLRGDQTSGMTSVVRPASAISLPA